MPFDELMKALHIELWANKERPFEPKQNRWAHDPPYLKKDWDKLQRIPNIDCDIYLDHSTKENGCLWGIPDHHLVGHIEIENFTEEELFNCPGIIPFETEPGDVIFHSLSAPHGSAGNKTDGLRRTFYIHFNNKEIYEQCYKDDPEVIKRKEQKYKDCFVRSDGIFIILLYKE